MIEKINKYKLEDSSQEVPQERGLFEKCLITQYSFMTPEEFLKHLKDNPKEAGNMNIYLTIAEQSHREAIIEQAKKRRFRVKH